MRVEQSNHTADKIARQEGKKSFVGPVPGCGVPYETIKGYLKTMLINQHWRY